MDCHSPRLDLSSALRLAALVAPLGLLAACGDDAALDGNDGQDEQDEQDTQATSEGDEAGASNGESGSAEGGEDVGEDVGESAETGSETGEPACDPLAPEALEREFLVRGSSREGVQLSACDYHVWWISAAADVETTLTLDAGVEQGVELAISYPDTLAFTNPIASATLYGPGALSFDAPRSGEFAVLVRAQNPGADPDLSLSYDLSVTCTNQCQLETTRFPITLVHGWTGFENIGPLDYFYGVRADLEALGYPVAVPVLDPYNAVEIRGEQLADFVELTLGAQRARKLNLFGHSQGGIDSRYVAADAGGGLGDHIGAVITLGTPHQGTPFTDIALGLIPGPAETVLVWLLNFLGAAQSQQSDVEASLYTLSETFMQGEFNATYLDHPQVQYWSWTGETCVAGIGCQDAVDPLLLFSYELIQPIAGANDGLVPESSAVWGDYLGLVPADHIDEIGQIGGLTSLSYDHIEFFRDNARMLADNEF
ncbi:hypothetical protein G6O69_11125 [Pseudenhygromyxa sp. WMMC2535]|uniref:lipase family alpha/beta hydrolase n=1 Tax=Pseudenhygromyxa sp. WMMC2535 TaxID=2712867 RepID=UPI0015564223|nr:hypothetical protein [Pseudenhygromyxa sp. WMMC2535]NVB38383.1 hypothetical protein [Pseudenhygromyxa sp. WMMC2535]